jgi:hypothetical protein
LIKKYGPSNHTVEQKGAMFDHDYAVKTENAEEKHLNKVSRYFTSVCLRTGVNERTKNHPMLAPKVNIFVN